MKIKNEVITTFLNKIKCDSEFSIEDIILDFSDGGMKINAINAPSTIVLTGELRKDAFIEYDMLGKIGIQRLGELINILKTFGEEVEINVEGNLLVIKEKGRKVETELIDVSLINEAPSLKKEMVFSENIIVGGKQIQEFISNASMNKEYDIRIVTEKGKITLSNTGRYKFTKEIETESALGGNDMSFGQPFVSSVKGFNGNITLSLGEAAPLKILEKTDMSVVSIITAPLRKKE